VTVTGYHFSRQQRPALNSAFYGTGLKGAEAQRLDGENDIRPRIFFYVDKGRGVMPEAGVGPHPHKLVMRNLYDVMADPLDFVRSQQGRGLSEAERMNGWERAIMQAGFDGYYSNDPVMPQAFAVLIGKHQVEVLPGKPSGFNAAPMEPTKPVNKTMREGEYLVRKPDADQSVPLIRLGKEIKEVAPSFHFQYGYARVNEAEASLANALLEDKGLDFRFSERNVEINTPQSNLKQITESLMVDNYSAMDGVSLNDMDAGEAMRDLDKRLDALRMVRNCLM
jgi:hypothetical protein